MIIKYVKNALIYVFLFLSMDSFAIAAPLCYPGSTANYPKPTGSGSPNPPNTSLVLSHGGSGLLGAATTATDKIKFTCPANRAGSFGFDIRIKNPPTDTLLYGGLYIGAVVDNNFAAGGIASISQWGYVFSALIYPVVPPYHPHVQNGKTNLNGPNYVVSVAKSLNPQPVQYAYELCVRCFQLDNLGGLDAAPLSAIYLQNQ